MVKNPQFEPRKLMEKSIDIMRQSVSEPRQDGKASPLVGAVLWKPDGTVETACRGELRDGDHAEFTLLERKNRNVRLDGSKLFTTLEPCAPGARKEPKKSCAERILWARIKEVWVGIEDPDPTVDRKGIKYLQDHGVTVNMFDRDLQEIIREANKDFIDQASERKAVEEEHPKDIILSTLENTSATVDMGDFSPEALEQYRLSAKITDSIDSETFKTRFLQQGLLKKENSHTKATGFGVLLFGKEPRLVMPQAGLLATIHYPDGSEEIENFEGPMILIPAALEKWLSDKLPNVIDRNRMQRNEIPPIPFEMVREAVVNALIHRDYGIQGAKCQLSVTADTITVKSPGGPLAPITLNQLQLFNAPMLSRNPGLHYVFAKMELAEERGLGIKSLKKRAEELGLPLPKYSYEDPYLVLTIFRTKGSATRALEPRIFIALNKDELAGWEFVSSRTFVTAKVYADKMGFDKRKAQRHLKRFVDLGLLDKILEGPSTQYMVVRR